MMRSLQVVWSNHRGMALLITIMVVSLLIGVTVQFNKNVRQGYFTSVSQLEGQRLFGIARSGIAIASALLESDAEENSSDSLHDVWAKDDPENFTGLFVHGKLVIEVEDLSGRLQINSLVQLPGDDGNSGAKVNEIREILKQLLVSSILVEEGEERAREIVDSLVDWLDPDDDESEFGAESGYYRSLGASVTCRNGPIPDIGELLMVKGITPEILYGTGDRPGLAEYITVYGLDGMMNINTMPKLLLQALHPLMTETLAEMLDEYRRAEENGEALADVSWYGGVDGFPGDIELPANVLSTKSSFFRIRSEGRLAEQVRRVTAVVERRNEGGVALIETRME